MRTGPAAAADDPARSPGMGLAQVVAAGALWGTGGLVVTVLHDDDGLGAMTTSAWRMLIATVALVAFVAVTGRGGLVLDTMRRHPVLATTVGVGTAVYQGLYFAAVLAAGVTAATVISLGLAPILAAAWEHLRAGTRPSRRELVVLVLALAGLGLMSAFTDGHSGSTGSVSLGLALAVASGATYAATTLVGHRVAEAVDPVALTTCATATGALILAPFLLVAAVAGDPVVTTRPSGVLLLAYLGVATMALSYVLLYAGLRTTSGSVATIATLVEPLSAALLAVLLLNQQLTWQAALGGLLILVGVVGLRSPRPPDGPSTA